MVHVINDPEVTIEAGMQCGQVAPPSNMDTELFRALERGLYQLILYKFEVVMKVAAK